MTTNTDLARAPELLPALPESDYTLTERSGVLDKVEAHTFPVFTAEQMRAYGRAAVDQAADAVPEGTQRVPIEPTKEMIASGDKTLVESGCLEGDYPTAVIGMAELLAADTYRAMLAASAPEQAGPK